MMDFEELRSAAASMLQVNMSLRKGERVAFFSDVPAVEDWENLPEIKLFEMTRRAMLTRSFFEMMKTDFPECRFDYICFHQLGQHGKEPDDHTAHRLLGYDVLILMTTFSLSHTHAREKASRQGARVASMPEVESSMFAAGGPMAADYTAISRETQQWTELLSRGQQVRVTTPFGTDLSFSISGRQGGADTGLLHAVGEFGNLPGGEAYIAPVEGTAQGRLVVPPNWYPHLKEEMTLTFNNGYVTALDGGGQIGDHFRQLFDFGNDGVKHRRNCAELGIGTNPNASRPDNVLEAEKIRGSVHVAVGDSSHLGGVNESDLHDDFVLTQPTLYIDNDVYLKDGEKV
jgi:aminopeptidase